MEAIVPFWISLGTAVVAGLFGGIVGPLVTASLARRNWRQQKRLELAYDVFRGATEALAGWMTDALDAKLQSEKVGYQGATREVEMRPETSRAMEHHRGLVEAFFSRETAAKFDEATRARISIGTVPNLDFEAKRLAFVKAAAAELGLCESHKE